MISAPPQKKQKYVTKPRNPKNNFLEYGPKRTVYNRQKPPPISKFVFVISHLITTSKQKIRLSKKTPSYPRSTFYRSSPKCLWEHFHWSHQNSQDAVSSYFRIWQIIAGTSSYSMFDEGFCRAVILRGGDGINLLTILSKAKKIVCLVLAGAAQ